MDRSRPVEANEFSELRMGMSRSDLKKLQAADLIRANSTLALSRDHGVSPAEYFTNTWPLSISRDVVRRAFDLQTKAAILPGTVSDATWASPIAPVLPPSLVDAFVPLVTAQSAVLQLAPSCRSMRGCPRRRPMRRRWVAEIAQPVQILVQTIVLSSREVFGLW